MPVTMATNHPPLPPTRPPGLYSLVVSGREKELSLWQAADAENTEEFSSVDLTRLPKELKIKSS
jgi:hypothetical protein